MSAGLEIFFNLFDNCSIFGRGRANSTRGRREVSQRHPAHCFSAVSRPFSARFPPFLCAVRLPGAETERTGEKWRKMGEIWGRNGRETAVAEWRWGQAACSASGTTSPTASSSAATASASTSQGSSSRSPTRRSPTTWRLARRCGSPSRPTWVPQRFGMGCDCRRDSDGLTGAANAGGHCDGGRDL